MNLSQVIEQAKSMRLPAGQCLEVHLNPDDDILETKQVTTIKRFAQEWAHLGSGIANPLPSFTYVGIVHEDGAYVIPLESCAE